MLRIHQIANIIFGFLLSKLYEYEGILAGRDIDGKHNLP